MYFSDLHVQLLSKAILSPGEQLVGQTVTSYFPWWAMGFIRRQHLVLATDQRLILVEHRFHFFPASFRMHAVESMPWSQVQEARVTGLFLKKKLRVKGIGERGPVALTAIIPNAFFGLLAPMRQNMQGAKNIAAAFQGAKQLGPASNGYGAPQLAAAPVNAPGYASVPPPPVAAPQAPYGVPQQASFAPPPSGGQYPPRSWS